MSRWSEEANAKRSATMRRYASSHPEWVENCRKSALGNKSNSGRTTGRAGKTLAEVFGEEKAAEIRRKISEGNRKRKGKLRQNPEWIAKRVAAFKAGLLAGKFKIMGGRAKAEWYDTPYGDRVYLKSGWERTVADFLTGWLGDKWRYEPKRFDLGSTTYAPDFWLVDVDTYIEVKGRTDVGDFALSLEKVDLLKKLHPEVRIVVLTSVRHKDLENLKKQVQEQS